MCGRPAALVRVRALAGVALALATLACGGAAPSIDTLTLPAGRVGQLYEVRLEASGPEATWALVDGRLPAGLALSKLGTIGGTPEEAGRFDLVVEAAAASGRSDRKPLVLLIGEGRPLTLHTERLPEAVVGLAYGARLDATGGVPPYRWSVTAGALPEGLAFAAEGIRAQLAGAPRAAGTFEFALEVRDDRGASVARQITLVVSEQRTPIRIATESLPAGRRGLAYRAELVSGGGAGESLAWDVSTGSLPPGLTLGAFGSPATTVTGTPTQSGRYTFEVTVTEASGGVASQTLTVEVEAEPLRVGPAELPVAEVGRSYHLALEITGGTGRGARVTVEEGALPRGVFLVAERLEGTPAEPGRFPLVLAARDDGGTATVALSLEVLDALRLDLERLPDGEVGGPYAAQATVTGGVGDSPLFDALGLPPGLATEGRGDVLDIAGVPSRAGSQTATIAVTDGANRTALFPLGITIHPALEVATGQLPPAQAGVPYDAPLTARGGAPGPRTWKILAGRLPYGLALDAVGGRIVGTATTAGRHPLGLGVEGARTATRAFVLEVR